MGLIKQKSRRRQGCISFCTLYWGFHYSCSVLLAEFISLRLWDWRLCFSAAISQMSFSALRGHHIPWLIAPSVFKVSSGKLSPPLPYFFCHNISLNYSFFLLFLFLGLMGLDLVYPDNFSKAPDNFSILRFVTLIISAKSIFSFNVA